MGRERVSIYKLIEETGRNVEGKEYNNIILSIKRETPVLWDDGKPARVDRISCTHIETIEGSPQYFTNGEGYIVTYKGSKYLCWKNAYCMVYLGSIDDKCGDCVSKCRRKEGKCGFYESGGMTWN